MMTFNSPFSVLLSAMLVIFFLSYVNGLHLKNLKMSDKINSDTIKTTAQSKKRVAGGGRELMIGSRSFKIGVRAVLAFMQKINNFINSNTTIEGLDELTSYFGELTHSYGWMSIYNFIGTLGNTAYVYDSIANTVYRALVKPNKARSSEEDEPIAFPAEIQKSLDQVVMQLSSIRSLLLCRLSPPEGAGINGDRMKQQSECSTQFTTKDNSLLMEKVIDSSSHKKSELNTRRNEKVSDPYGYSSLIQWYIDNHSGKM